MNKEILKKILIGDGFYSDLKISKKDLCLFKKEVSNQYLMRIKRIYPDLYKEAERLQIKNYHLLKNINHNKLWHKKYRCLQQKSISLIKKTNFFKDLERIFGKFKLSKVAYDSSFSLKRDEIYWRIVRPNNDNDIGEYHADKWFHELMNDNHKAIPKNMISIKLWLPLVHKLKSNDLLLVPMSHKKNYDYEIIDSPNGKKPVLKTNLRGRQMLEKPNTVLIFNENMIHKGSINKDRYTRISAEITILIKNDIIKLL